jgi:integrase
VRVKFAGKTCRNTFSSYDSAYQWLTAQIDSNELNSDENAALYPLRHSRRDYSEIESLLYASFPDVTVREAVDSYIAHRKNASIVKTKVSECCAKFIQYSENRLASIDHLRTLKKHLNPFCEVFGDQYIDEVNPADVSNYLFSGRNQRTGKPWSPVTKNNLRGSLVGLENHAKKILRAMDQQADNFSAVGKTKGVNRGEVDIYTVDELRRLLSAAVETDLEIVPVIVLQCFLGFRPSEAHGERNRRPRFSWSEVNIKEDELTLTHQKVASLRFRLIPFHHVCRQWLLPYVECCSGPVWKPKESYTVRYAKVKKAASVRSVPDGLRHSYASYRLPLLGGHLDALAGEMGNSVREIVGHYRKVTSRTTAEEWFKIFPPDGFPEKVKAWMASR